MQPDSIHPEVYRLLYRRNATVTTDSDSVPQGIGAPYISWVALEFQTIDLLLSRVVDRRPVLGREDMCVDRFGDIGARFANFHTWGVWRFGLRFPLS